MYSFRVILSIGHFLIHNKPLFYVILVYTIENKKTDAIASVFK